MTTHTKLEQIAYAYATGRVLSDFGQHKTGYEAYLHLCSLEDKGELSDEQVPEDITARDMFENWSWIAILDRIDSDAAELLNIAKRLLSLAQTGIVQSAIDGTLDSDMTQLDLQAMIELGGELDEAEVAGGGYAA